MLLLYLGVRETEAPISGGGGSSKKVGGPSASQLQLHKKILEEDEMIMSVIKAFLRMVQ